MVAMTNLEKVLYIGVSAALLVPLTFVIVLTGPAKRYVLREVYPERMQSLLWRFTDWPLIWFILTKKYVEVVPPERLRQFSRLRISLLATYVGAGLFIIVLLTGVT